MSTRPEPEDLAHGEEGWDTTVNENFGKVFGTPFPPAEYANAAALPAAAGYVGCVAYLTDEALVVMSDGTSWLRLGTQVAVFADAAGWADATAQAKFNALLAAMRLSKVLKT